MSIPKRHHYLPKFYLKRWARNDEVVEYSRPHKKVLARPRTPYATGFEWHLYSLPGEAVPEDREQVELKWMQVIDDKAAPVLEQLVADPGTKLTQAQSDAWIAFLLSLIFRTPARLRWMQDRIRDHDYAFDDDERAAYDALRPKGAPSTPEQYFSQSSDDELSVARMQLMLSMIQSKVLGSGVAAMEWRVLEVKHMNRGLLTSDDPIITSNGLNEARSFIILPLGPAHLFVATNTEAAFKAFSTQSDRALERAMNNSIVAQAEALVIGATDDHLAFVGRRLGMSPAGTGFLGRHTWACP